MKKILTFTAFFLIATISQASSLEEYEELEKKAMAGDYQAQRNIAYWLTGGNDGAPPLNPVLGCAWRLVILKSGNVSVDSSDVRNKQFYCDKKLDMDSQKAAEAQAAKLLQAIKSPSKKR